VWGGRKEGGGGETDTQSNVAEGTMSEIDRGTHHQKKKKTPVGSGAQDVHVPRD